LTKEQKVEEVKLIEVMELRSGKWKKNIKLNKNNESSEVFGVMEGITVEYDNKKVEVSKGKRFQKRTVTEEIYRKMKRNT